MTKLSVFDSKLALPLVIVILLGVCASESDGQRPRFPDFFQTQAVPAIQSVPTTQGVFGATNPGFGLPQGQILPGSIVGAPIAIGQPTISSTPPFGSAGVFSGAPQLVSPGIQTAPPPGSIIAPSFDPFRSNVQPLPFGSFNGGSVSPLPSFGGANTVPSLGQPLTRNLQVLPPVPQTQPGAFPGAQGGFGQPQFGQPQLGLPQLGQPRFGQPQLGQFGQPQFGQPGFQTPQLGQPRSIFGAPNFGFGAAPVPTGPLFPRVAQSGQSWRRFRDEFLPRLFERPRVRHTYIAGNNGNELEINDTEIATTLTIPRLLFIQQPFRITPGFIAHFWDGPVTDGEFGTGFDLPETAFSAFLNLEHLTDPNMQAGLESSLTVGLYSDYENVNSDSFRVTGTALGWARLNPTKVFKFGVEYFDRVDLKLLPAFGLFIRPSQDLELDLYFPRPRIAQRIPNFRNFEMWSYLAGEYGGGSWTVERIGPLDDQIDINDFRAVVGLEWVGPRNVNGFTEIGYVFNRELVSRLASPSRELELQDSILVRLGLAF